MQQLYHILIESTSCPSYQMRKKVHAQIYGIFEGKNGQVPGLLSGVRHVELSGISNHASSGLTPSINIF